MLTRAIALLIIVGDDATLRTNGNWTQLLEYCEDEKNNIMFKNGKPKDTKLLAEN